jgi:hypothetical protein
MRCKTPVDLVPVSGYPGAEDPLNDEPMKTGHLPVGNQKGRATPRAPGDLRFSYCGLTFACSVYHPIDQLGDVK